MIWIYAFQIWIGRRLLNYGLVFVFFTLIDMFYQTIDCDIYWLNLFRWLFDYNAGVKRKGVHFPFELIQQICLLPCSCYCSTLKFTVHNFQEFDCFSAASSVSFSKEKYFHQLTCPTTKTIHLLMMKKRMFSFSKLKVFCSTVAHKITYCKKKC